MYQTWENDKKTKFGSKFGLFGTNLGPQFFFREFYMTFTLEPTFTNSKLIRIWFKTSSDNIYPFPTVDTRLRKRNNDCFQFSRLHLYIIMTGAKVCSKCCKDVSNLLNIFRNIIHVSEFRLRKHDAAKKVVENNKWVRR